MKVLVCGGRNFFDKVMVWTALDKLHREHGFTVLIHGAASGADTLAGLWAKNQGVTECIYAADWRMHGASAGPIRNQKMLDHGCPKLVVAFPGGPGTSDMVSRAKAAGVRVIEMGK